VLTNAEPGVLSTEALNDTWKLRANGNANGDSSKIDSWSIAF
jgi:hypothetical protein